MRPVAGELETRILTGLRDILFGRDDLLAEFAQAFRAEVDRLRRTHHQDGTARRTELEKVERGIARCLAFITDGDGHANSVRSKLIELEHRKAELDRALRQAPPSPQLVIHPNIGELYRRKIGELESLLLDASSRPRAMEMIRSMIDRIEIAAGAKRGQTTVTLVGALASILDFASRDINAKAAVGDGGFGRVLLVAGAGFEPAAFRL